MRRSRNQGSVLVILLAFSAIVALLGGGMITLSYHSQVRVGRTARHMAARVAADAGLTVGTHALVAEFYGGSLDPLSLPAETAVSVPNSQETFSYTVSQDDSGDYVIVSAGTCQNQEVSVEAVMVAAPVIHEYALLAQSELVLGNSATVDLYNGDSPLQVGTNSTDADGITLYPGAHVDGDILVGAGGDPQEVIDDMGGSYTGTADAQGTNEAIPPVVVPNYLISAADSGGITADVTLTDSGKYERISLGNSETLVVDGNVELYVTGPVTLGNGAQIEIKEGSSLVLYVDGNVEFKNGSELNNLTTDPRAFRIMGTESCAQVELKNAGDLYAIVYAPHADVTLYNSAAMWGSVTSETAELKSGASFHYDATLASYEDPLLNELKLARWREY